MFFKRNKLVKDNKRYSAELLYKDVSPDNWDQENLTVRNLDFSIDSVRIINEYADRLFLTDDGKEVLKNHFENFTTRIGAYLGEVLKQHLRGQYEWYEWKSVKKNTNHLNDRMYLEGEAVLYSKELDDVLFPIYEANLYLTGKSTYTHLLAYIEDVINNRGN